MLIPGGLNFKRALQMVVQKGVWDVTMQSSKCTHREQIIHVKKAWVAVDSSFRAFVGKWIGSVR